MILPRGLSLVTISSPTLVVKDGRRETFLDGGAAASDPTGGAGGDLARMASSVRNVVLGGAAFGSARCSGGEGECMRIVSRSLVLLEVPWLSVSSGAGDRADRGCSSSSAVSLCG